MARRKQPASTPCRWTYDDMTDSWDTACDNKHCFITDGPRENNHAFCPYCGRALKACSASEGADDGR